MNHIQNSLDNDKKFLKKIAFLDSKQRENIIPPERLLSNLPIKKDHIVLDVGAGTGFFTIPMAEITSNEVYAMDLDLRMLNVIKSKAMEKKLENIKLIHESLEYLSLEKETIDFVMASLILHEVPSLKESLTKIFEIMKIGGFLLCLEYEKDESIVEGPPMDIRIHSSDLEKILLSIGFEIEKNSKINNAIYTILAKK